MGWKRPVSNTRRSVVRLRVLSLEGLLKTKSGARPKDQMDAAVIARALEQLGRK
jgi:hypothetical protein